jgi:two-component system OmpR family response regulator
VRVLVVEDSTKLAGLLQRGLTEEGHAVDLAANGIDGLWLGSEQPYDAIVLDVGLPDIDGFEVCHRLRSAERWMPVLMLTARDAPSDRVRGLDGGADDYLVKPFSFPELLARLRALHRRPVGPRPTRLYVGDLHLDPASKRVRRGEVAIELTATEFALLEHLMRYPGQARTRAQLLSAVWSFGFDGDPHVVTVYVSYLREKIDRPFGRRSLQTLRGHGYRICDDTAVSSAG